MLFLTVWPSSAARSGRLEAGREETPSHSFMNSHESVEGAHNSIMMKGGELRVGDSRTPSDHDKEGNAHAR